LINFYSAEALDTAKDILIKAFEALKLKNWTRPANRRKDIRENTGNKLNLMPTTLQIF